MNKFICSLSVLLLFLAQSLTAKTYNCENLSFEKGDFTNWTGKTWLHFYTEILNPLTGIEPGRHTIMSDTTAYDRNTGGKLKKIPAGYKYSARLGDAVNGCLSESLSYTLTVDSANALFIWKFAVVLQDPLQDHLPDEHPRFKITLEDQDGNVISSCSQYDVNAAADIPGFQTYYPTGYSSTSDSIAPVVWRDWTTAGANLMPFYGKQVTITFSAEDCTKQGHYGYAYFVAECHPMEVSVSYCKDDTNAQLEAPEGFSSYVWTPGNIQGRTLTVNNATEGNQYQCTFQSVMGCQIELSATIKRTTPTAAFKYTSLDTSKKQYQFLNSSTTSSGTISDFSWDFGDGSYSTEENPTHSFSITGTHVVTLEVTSSPSGCKNKKSMSISIPDQLTVQGNTSFCTGQSTQLTATGRIRYLWSTGDTTATINVAKNGSFSVIGWDSIGYSDTAYINVTAKALPIVTISGQKILCSGKSSTLTASGAVSYLWNNNDTASSIDVTTAGTYSVVGTSSDGCTSKLASIDVTQDSGFQPIIIGDSLFCSNSQATLTASGAIAYQWNTGSTAQTITIYQSGTYVVLGTDKNGCQAQASKFVTKVPLPDASFELTPDKLNVRNPIITGSVATKEEVNYEWQLGDGSIVTTASFTHRYEVSNTTSSYSVTLNAVDKYGCTNSFTKSILLDLKVPNVFTPNNDGYNDLFMPDYDLQIFDRNGILLYAGNKGWNGTYRGAKMDPDTYFYLLRYTDANNVEQVKKGYVMLVK